MTDKRIKSYLEDRLKMLESIRNEREWTTSELGDIACCKQTLAFIDSMQEVPVSEDLETFAKKESEAFAEREYEIGYFDRNALGKGYYWGCVAGAKWQKEQMMSKAIDAKLLEGHLIRLKSITHPLHVGDKVKVIIIKED